MPNLFDLQRELDELYRAVEAAGGEITVDEAIRLDEALTALAQKVDSAALYRSELAARRDGLKAFAAQVQERARVADNMLRRLDDYCDKAMGKKGELPGENLTMRRVQNPPRVEITDEEALRKSFPKAFEKDVSWKINKAVVKAALKRGDAVEGARMTQGTRVEFR